MRWRDEIRAALSRHPVRTRGQLEVDLYGAAPENKPELMIRHAFLEIWSKDGEQQEGQEPGDVQATAPAVPELSAQHHGGGAADE